VKPYFEDDAVTIYHGDCREVWPLLGPVGLILTDPPYGIGLMEHGRNGYNWAVVGDESQAIGVEMLATGGPQIVFANPMKPWPGKWRQFLVWDKGPTVGGGGDPAKCWKQSWELVQVRGTPRLNGQRDEAVLRCHVTQQDYHWHPCQKPVRLLRYLIEKATEPNELVLDPFMGSGSTLRAAKDAGRRAIGIETEERYCEIAAKRMAQAVLL
jgi:DNA modification methylase